MLTRAMWSCPTHGLLELSDDEAESDAGGSFCPVRTEEDGHPLCGQELAGPRDYVAVPPAAVLVALAEDDPALSVIRAREALTRDP